MDGTSNFICWFVTCNVIRIKLILLLLYCYLQLSLFLFIYLLFICLFIYFINLFFYCYLQILSIFLISLFNYIFIYFLPYIYLLIISLFIVYKPLETFLLIKVDLLYCLRYLDNRFVQILKTLSYCSNNRMFCFLSIVAAALSIIYLVQHSCKTVILTLFFRGSTCQCGLFKISRARFYHRDNLRTNIKCTCICGNALYSCAACYSATPSWQFRDNLPSSTSFVKVSLFFF
jgi:hypothetical protein